MIKLPEFFSAPLHDAMLDFERVFQKARLIDLIDSRSQDTYGADEDEITLIRDEITDYRAKIRQLD